MPSSQEAFFGVLESPDVAITDNDLRESVVDFLAMWPKQHLATFSDLSADAQVLAVSAQLLPDHVTFYNWVERRMHRDIELREEGDGITIHLTRQGRDIVVAHYKARLGHRLLL